MKEINEDGKEGPDVPQNITPADRAGEKSKSKKARRVLNQLFCGVCRMEFSSWSALRDHLRDMHVVQKSLKGFSCGACNRSYVSLVTVINHLHRIHTEEKISGCSKCGLKFLHPRTVSTKCDMNSISERHCKKCKRECRDSESVQVRRELKALTGERATHSKRPKEVPKQDGGAAPEKDCRDNIGCEYCQFSFPSTKTLERHIRLLHPGKTLHVCEVCGKKFVLKCFLEVHHSVFHPPKHVCSVCEKDFPTRRKLLAHGVSHTVGQPHACAICDKTFKTKRSLRCHCRKHTEKYVCDVCGREFSDRSYLGVHKRSHTGERPYPCAGCDKKFSTLRHLKTHYRIHSGEKPYSCETCGRAFSRREHLKTHLRVHTGEKPFVCDICRRGFSQKWVMYTHRRIHTGERPFECDVCQRAFIYKSQLKTHQQTHEKDAVLIDSLDCEP